MSDRGEPGADQSWWWVFAAVIVCVCAAAGAIIRAEHLVTAFLILLLVAACVRALFRTSLAMFVVLLGGIAAYGAQQTTASLRYDGLPSTGRWVEIQGLVVEDPRPSRWSTDVAVSVDSVTPAIEGLPSPFRTLVRATRPNAGRLLGLDRGDRVTLRGTLYQERAEYLQTRHIGTRFALQEIDRIDFDHGRISPLMALRRTAVSSFEGLPGSSGPLLAGFVFGDTRRVSPETVQTMRAAGLSHLFAVSGANVTFVIAGFQPLLMFLPLRARLLASLVITWVFVAITGAPPSIVRAGAMLSAALFDRWRGLGRFPIRGLAGAVTVCVLIDPYLVRSLGFALSVAATAGIVGLSPWLGHRLGGGRFAELLAPTLSAQLCAMPLLFGAGLTTPIAGIAANVWAAALVGPITLGGVALAAISSVAPSVTPPFRWMLSLLVLAFLGGAEHFARGPGWSLPLLVLLFGSRWKRISLELRGDGEPARAKRCPIDDRGHRDRRGIPATPPSE